MDPEKIPDTPSDPEEETLDAPSDPDEKTLEVPSDPDEKTYEVPLDSEETQKAPLNPEKERQEALSDPEEETKDVAGLASWSTDLEGLVVPARRKLTLSGNLPPIMSSRTWSRRVHAGVEGAAPQSILRTIEYLDGKGDEENTSICDGGGSMILQTNVEVPEPIARDMSLD